MKKLKNGGFPKGELLFTICHEPDIPICDCRVNDKELSEIFAQTLYKSVKKEMERYKR